MFKEFLKNPRALIYAVLVHVALVVILVVSLNWNSKPAPLQGSGHIIKAVVIDEAKLQAEKQHKLQEQQRKRAEEEAKRRAAEQKRQAELQKQRAAEKQKRLKAERQRKAKLKAQQEAREHQRIAEQKRQAELAAKRKAEEVQRKAAEAKRKAAEAKRKAEEQRKADEARRQRENLEMMQQQMAQEEQQRAAEARKRHLLALESKYVTLIQQKVTRNWIRPPIAQSGMSCTVHVRLIPGGEVVEATTVKSSGYPEFDRSAEQAIYHASPLPPPPDPALFQREFNFVFKPEG